MKTSLVSLLIFIQLFEACAGLLFRQQAESQSLHLSCTLGREHSSLTGLHLYQHSLHGQTTLLSMARGGDARGGDARGGDARGGDTRVTPGHRGRLQLRGDLDSLQVNVTISRLQPSDAGLYLWELSYSKGSSDRVRLCGEKVFLLVEGAAGKSCRCSPSYPPLLSAVSAAAGLLVLTLSCLAMHKCAKARNQHTPHPPAPIYEEMTRKQQSAANPQNNPEAHSHLEEANFPVYANPGTRRLQDNYYACPRQLALDA